MTDAPDAPQPGEPGSANSPATPGGVVRMSDRVSPGAPPPGSNQGKDESMPAARDVTGAAGTVASADPQSPQAQPSAAPARAGSPGLAGAAGMTPEQSRPDVDLGSGPGREGQPASDTGGSASRVPGEQGRSVHPMDPVAQLDAARTAPGAPPASVPPGTTAPGNAQGVSVPATEAAPGTSQESFIVEGVRSSRGAVPGHPEGEVDTRA